MLIANYKLICFLIWVVGILSIDITWVCCQGSLSELGVGLNLFSSIPFAALAIYTKLVFENTKLSSYHRNMRFSGIALGGILAVLMAIYSFFQPMNDAFTAEGFFVYTGGAAIFFGFIVGALGYAAVIRLVANRVINK